MNTLPTVTIGLAAHNEEATIVQLLTSIAAQKQTGYTLTKVQIECDGCTDKTVEVARSFVNQIPGLVVHDNHDRKGQATRLNTIYKSVITDLFIGTDADVALDNPHVLSELVKPFNNPIVMLVGGNDLPATPRNFIERSLAVYEYCWKDIVAQLPDPANVHNLPGRLYAASASYIRTTQIPQGIFAHDHFLFLNAKKQHLKTAYADDAVVRYRVPSTLSDYISQMTRFIDTGGDIEEYFGLWAEPYYAIPRNIKLQSYIPSLKRYHVYFLSSVALQIIQRIVGFIHPLSTKKGYFTEIRSSKIPSIMKVIV
ncbi:MAG TPA: glycosyltransferase [Patescibacteria group bacterium]|nr:glycosyltransferase [Patescibacteria group bacterium]